MAMTETTTNRHQRSLFSSIFRSYGQEVVIFLSIIVLFAVVTMINPRFMSPENMNTIFSGMPISQWLPSAWR